jgi:sphingomyelin phosphodiesterase acid-like 3
MPIAGTSLWVRVVSCAMLLAATVPLRAEEAHRALIVSDLHFDPFSRGAWPAALAAADIGGWTGLLAPAAAEAPSAYGRDTNTALLRSALAAVSRQSAGADLVIVPGDLISHRFEQQAARALNAGETSDRVRGFAVKTALYVLRELREAAPGRPIVVGLGNNDSECGDYRLEPNGPFLAGLRDAVRAMAGAELLAPDFDTTFAAAGYYRMRHPAADGVDIVVVNDVLWSTDYRDRCGARGAEAAAAMLDWLEATLREIRAAGRRAWLVHHIPVGIDGYTSMHRKAPSCAARVTPYLKEPYASRFTGLIRAHGAEIALMISGHIHHDTYRVIRSGDQAVAVDKIAPGISPIYGNNPGFQILRFDGAGRPRDIETWFLPLNAPATAKPAWRLEYVFTRDYHQPAFSEEAVAELAGNLLSKSPSEQPIRRGFSRAYPVGHGAIGAASFRGHACAVSEVDPAAYATCLCRP